MLSQPESPYFAVCEQASQAAGNILLEMQPRIQGREKGPNDVVTDADFAAQRTIREILLNAFPEYGFLGEEDEPGLLKTLGTNAGGPEYCWVVDPLDGTTNYVHGLQNFAVSIALVHRQSIACGVVYDPVAKESFWAERGAGAWLNGKRLTTSGCTEAAKALVAASFAPKVPRGSREIIRFTEALHRCQGVRRLGSAALNLSYVAAGRLDAYWATSVKIWDVAAGLLLVEEAGGNYCQIDGGLMNLDKPELLAAASLPLRDDILPWL